MSTRVVPHLPWPSFAHLDRLCAAGLIESVDRHFAASIASMCGEKDDAVLTVLALTSRAVQHGHVCLDLQHLPPLVDAAGESARLDLPAPSELCDRLGRSPTTTLFGDLLALPSGSSPLLLDEKGRVYLRRYAAYQTRLARALLQRAQGTLELDWPLFGRSLTRFFGGTVPREQALAALVVARGPLSIIFGGPGTGKTSTVCKLLALLLEQPLASKHGPLRVLLLAPTGKAAARLNEAVNSGLVGLGLPNTLLGQQIAASQTIHRALGYQSRTPTRFYHGTENPLPADVVVVDEASMVDLSLMTKLVEAVRPDARLILLGDKDQLASVEAGAILGDVCANFGSGYSQDFAAQAQHVLKLAVPVAEGATAKLTDCMARLSKSYRYPEHSSIARLAQAINHGAEDEAIALLQHASTEQEGLRWLHPEVSETWREAPQVLMHAMLKGLNEFLHCHTPEEQLLTLGRFRVLCAHRRGRDGSEALNRALQLARASHFPALKPSSPILITQNDYSLELFNGDMGVLSPDEHGELRGYFLTPQGLRAVLPARLPQHETAYAMTVHTSQGSEFDQVLVVLPRDASAILTRELLYTAVTRARKGVTLWGSEAVIRACISRTVDRGSGLRDALSPSH